MSEKLDDLLNRIEENIEADDDRMVRRLVADNRETLLAYPGTTGDLLLAAVERGLIGAVIALLDGGARVNWANELGGTPLLEAAWRGRLEIARVLVQAGADVDWLASVPGDRNHDPSIAGRCALHFAQVRDHTDLVGLLEPLTSPEVRQLAQRATKRERARMQATEPSLTLVDRKLFWAISDHDLPGLLAALKAGANPAARDGQQWTPVILTTIYRQHSLLAALLAAGAKADDPADLPGRSALWMVVRGNHQSMMAPLLAAGADPNRRDDAGRTIWDLATRSSAIDSLRQAWRDVHGTEPPG